MTESTELINTDYGIIDARTHPAMVYLASLAESGRYTQRNALNQVAGIILRIDPRIIEEEKRRWLFTAIPWQDMRYPDVVALRDELATRYKPATGNKMLSAVKRVLKESWRLQLVSTEDYHRAVDVERIKGKSLPPGRAATSGELSALMGVCATDSPDDIRDAALISIMYICGLRRAEIISLDLADLDTEAYTLRVVGKGDNERFAHVTNGAQDALADWLELRGDKPGPLFLSVRKGHIRHSEGRLTTTAVYSMLRRRCKRAGIRPISPHDLRRTCATELIRLTGDVVMAQRVLGHKSIHTTERYDMRGEDEKRAACELLSIPYRRHYGHD